MAEYKLPKPQKIKKSGNKEVVLVASGDLRLSANQKCWPAQLAMEQSLTSAIESEGYKVRRAHAFDKEQGHGFIASQEQGMQVFSGIDPNAKLIVAEAVWQYSHHVLAGLISHKGPILTVANWSGTWPGLVGMLNLNGSMTKAGVSYSTLWGEKFTDAKFRSNLGKWLSKGTLRHATKHVTSYSKVKVPLKEKKLGTALATQMQQEKAIMGVFDEGCMGMFNAIIPDHLLNPTGLFKERLSQSALYYEASCVSNDEGNAVRQWMEKKGLKFKTGSDHDIDLTNLQILKQCKMYVAALRIADDYGCDTIGIQYQQGLKDLMPASDLAEGTLNNKNRPPVRSRDGSRILYKGEPLPHFNEVDECAGIDGLMTYRIHKAMGQPVENTLHDIRWGDIDKSGSTDEYVWVFLISGAAPPEHFIGGWKGATSVRQPPMYFPNGGGTLKGISKPGEIIWSRVYVENDRLKMDLGRAGVLKLTDKETKRRWEATTPQWPIMHAVTYGVSRDQMMARHKSNHIQVAYAKTAADADKAMFAKAAMADALGMEVAICGSRKNGKPWN
ncbi:MAG: fucose isomerase [Blastopirellula sp.]|nr:MAG: fucose isomerase [Blastopirellula sp.]